MDSMISPLVSIASSSRHGGSQDYILGLPTEIMVLIAEHVLPNDLPALRLTCTDINFKIFDTFAKVHFTEKAFILPHVPSMSAMVAISEHPILGRRMKKILLHMTIIRTVDSCYRHDTGRPCALQETYQWSHRNLRIGQMHSLKNSLWRCLLEQALLNFAKIKREIELVVVCPTDEVLPRTDRITACGILAMKRDAGLDDLFKSAWEFKHTRRNLNYAHLLKLVQAAHMSVIGLKRTDHTASIIASSFVVPSVFPGKAFDQLRVLGLYLGERRLAMSTEIEEMIQAIRTLPTLESVTFLADWYNPNSRLQGLPDPSQSLLALLRLPALREMELYGFFVDPDDLMCFVRRHRKTLLVVIVQGVADYLPSQLDAFRSKVAEIIDNDHAHVQLLKPTL